VEWNNPALEGARLILVCDHGYSSVPRLRVRRHRRRLRGVDGGRAADEARRAEPDGLPGMGLPD
jgi:hypothetical protein